MKQLYIIAVKHQYYENDTIQTVTTLETVKAENMRQAITEIDESDAGIGAKVIQYLLLDLKPENYNITEKRFDKYCEQEKNVWKPIKL